MRSASGPSRTIFFLCVLAAGLLPLELQAQPARKPRPKPAEPFPFIPRNFADGFEQFAEPLFGRPTPEEEQKLAAITISPAEEKAYGEQQVQAFTDDLRQQGVRVLRSGREVEYLRKLVAVIRPHMKHAERYTTIRVCFVDAPQVDARAFPGGTLFFYKGLLSFAETEAALIGIVGHELSHLDREHLLIPLKRSKFLQSEQPNGKTTDWQKPFADAAFMMRVMARPFRPEDEAAADRDGARWAFQAGYDPRELARLFDRMHQKTQDPKWPLAGYFRSHPFNDDRRDAIEAESAELQNAVGEADAAKPRLYRGKRNLSVRTPKAEQEFDE